MTSPLIYLVAGEPSGDLLASSVMHALNEQSHGQVRFAGVGGAMMQAQGLNSFFPMKEISFMGFVEIIPHIPNILTRLQQTVEHIEKIKPSVVITFDAPGFNFRLAKRLHYLNIPLIHYTAPSVWAWRPGRAAKIAKLFDHLLTLFAFEPEYFQVHNLATTFVGHPLVEKNIEHIDGAPFRHRYGFASNDPMIVVLPGSRINEIKRLLPIYVVVLKALGEYIPHLRIVVPTLPHLIPLIKTTIGSTLRYTIVTDEHEKYQAMRASQVALVTSGTTTLELTLAQTPMVVAYKANKVTEWIVRPLLKINHFALPNILAKREIVKEFIQEHCNPDNIYNELLMLLKNTAYKEQQQLQLHDLIPTLKREQNMPSVEAARIILRYCTNMYAIEKGI